MIERLKYWLFQKGKGCHHCCIRCEYFDICRWDVMTGKTAEQEQTVELLAVEAARKDGNTGLLYQIYKYTDAGYAIRTERTGRAYQTVRGRTGERMERSKEKSH